jgi:enoyl-CoA hydratase
MNGDEIFKVEKNNYVAWLIFNRPDQRNTMTLDFFRKLEEQVRQLDEDPDVRVIVIRAEGKSFTAGIDLNDAASLLSDSSASGREVMRREILKLQGNISALEQIAKPVIVAVHGHCIGGGIDLICACDIRMASREAVFSIRETRIGIIADVGTLQRMPLLIGHGRFQELALTGRDFSAEEAMNMGLITTLCESPDDLVAEAGRVADEIAKLPPLTVQGVKEVIRYSRDNGIYEGLQYVAQKNSAALPSEDLMEAVGAFMEKREPVFKGNSAPNK